MFTLGLYGEEYLEELLEAISSSRKIAVGEKIGEVWAFV